ncbi:MAG: hypothetical protein H0X62_13735 [Bacteroidetes bacterium]|nr:hypothetical protein [Bacteroidota bacterium]
MKKIILGFALFAFIGTTSATTLVVADNVCICDDNGKEKGKKKNKKKDCAKAEKACSGTKTAEGEAEAKPACAKSKAEGKACCAKKAEAAAPAPEVQ